MPLTKINFSTAAAQTINTELSETTDIGNSKFLVADTDGTKYATLANITSGVLAEGNITTDVSAIRTDITNLQSDLDAANAGITNLNGQVSTINRNLADANSNINTISTALYGPSFMYFDETDNVWDCLNGGTTEESEKLVASNSAAKNIKEIKEDISDINTSITSINTKISTINSTATRHAGTFASTTIAGHVFLGTDTQISANSTPIGINADNKLAVENASATAYGVVKLTSDNTISTNDFSGNKYGHIYKTPDGKIALPIATTNVFGVIKKSSANGTSIPCIGVTDDGQAVLNVRTSHSGLEKEGNTIYVQTSTNEHPANDSETTAPVGTDSAGKLAVPAATTAKAGGVLLATAETDARANAVPTIAQFKVLLDRVAALETALASVTLVTAPETTTT